MLAYNQAFVYSTVCDWFSILEQMRAGEDSDDALAMFGIVDQKAPLDDDGSLACAMFGL